MKNFKGILILTTAIALGTFTGCQSWFHRGTSERSEGRVVDDKRITHQVQAELKTEPVYKFDDVDVKTFDGVVQLSGFVNTEEQKRRAAELAQHIPGVAQVVNNITLKPQAPTPTGR
jgi:osmotically-inducible protein OsmY